VTFAAGGVTFAVEPEALLTAEETDALRRLDRPPDEEAAPFVIELVPEPPWRSDDDTLFPRWEPAVQQWSGGRLRSSHASFTAEIDPLGGRARLCRRETRAYPLETVIRTSMMARLPLEGGLPLHAAGIVVEGRGVAFFGPSGAGKTTLAATSPHPVLSDELVAVAAADPFALVRSGFWGEGAGVARDPAPLCALVALDKGPRTVLERLSRQNAVRRVVGSITVPLVPVLWTRALEVLAALVDAVPVYRLEWTPSAAPWAELASALARTATTDALTRRT
jgi:hypothetical protein